VNQTIKAIPAMIDAPPTNKKSITGCHITGLASFTLAEIVFISLFIVAVLGLAYFAVFGFSVIPNYTISIAHSSHTLVGFAFFLHLHS
jgi:hypothetical protein